MTKPVDIGKSMKIDEPARIGVVLSSGGVRGIYAHTGFLLALKHLGIPITAISGCSASHLDVGSASRRPRFSPRQGGEPNPSEPIGPFFRGCALRKRKHAGYLHLRV